MYLNPLMSAPARVVVAAGVVLWACGYTAGHDLPPDWRGGPDSTWQHWQFPDAGTPTGPDEGSNPYGDPVGTVNGGVWHESSSGETGLWRLRDSQGDNMSFDVPNANNPAQSKKIVHIQITWKDFDGFDRPVIDFVPSGWEFLGEVNTEISAAWDHWASDWLYPSCLGEETIVIRPGEDDSWIDQVVIDSQCIPEPGSMTVLGLAAAGVFLARPRRMPRP